MSDEKDLNEEFNEEHLHDVRHVEGMYENWFLDYASYVILERAVPAIQDGFKPVQRRIMHSMKEMDDGRYNKVANVIGHTMKYHPHGDAAIGDAMVNLGQKDLLIDTQGNWGDVRTGDGAAAPRYIEARLSKLANHILFNPQITDWQLSYDGRNKEPVTLPVKFPLLLAQGVEGIAVGLATKIMPHNFIELAQESIKVLQGKKPKIFPDFATGGSADFSQYNDGLKGGKIKVRAKIEVVDKKTLAIREIPYGCTTQSVIDSILKANDQGKLKIRQIVDNTAKELEILITLPNGTSPDIMVDALYAFSDCEVSISPNCCVIVDEKPMFLGVSEILKICTNNTVEFLKKELEIRRGELMEKLLFSSLEKIFIENRIYRKIEECETWEAVIKTIDKGLDPFKPDFYREITEEDIVRLTEIKIKRISRYDTFKADELMKRLQEELKQVNYHLDNIIDYAVDYYQDLIDRFGKGKERRTEIRAFEDIKADIVAANNAKLYVNLKDGFIGTGLKKDEFVCECSDIDDVIVFLKNGICKVVKISDKVYVGKNIIHVAIFRKGDERMVYNMAYLDGGSGKTYVKRFQVLSVTRDREYDLTKGTKGSKTLYFSANPNGEAEIIGVHLTAGASARIKNFEYNFADLDIKGRGAGGNTLTKYPVRKVELKLAGKSTLEGLDIWFDRTVGRLNRDERGDHLGKFDAEDLILVFHKDGSYELTSFELTNRYDLSSILSLEKYNPEAVISCVYHEGLSKTHYVKRFKVETTTLNKNFKFVNEEKGTKLEVVTTQRNPVIEMVHKASGRGTEKKESVVNLISVIDVKGWKVIGNKLTPDRVMKVKLLEEQPVTEIPKVSDTAGKVEDAKVEKVNVEITEKPKDVQVGSTIELDVSSEEDDDQLNLF